jgi:glycine oxidase
MYLLKKNVTIIEENIKKISPHRILIGNSSMHFDWVCDCRGLGAKTFFPLLRGIRGELIWVKAPKVSIDKPLRILHPRYHLYIVPRPNDQYILGASEIESEDFSEISVRSTLEFLTLAFAIHTGFSEARILQTFTHCRPTLQHHLPEIQYTKGLVAINGLYRHGFLLAPILAHEVSQYISENISPQFSQIWNPYYDENIIEPK